MRWILPTLLTLTALACASVLLAACNASEARASTPGAVAQQVTHGSEVYAARCARCHGDAGQGSRKAPSLVGSGALPLHSSEGRNRTRPFRTALDIALFATEAMPPDDDVRSEMTADEYWSVLAFALTANGVALTDPVDAENAANIVLHP